MIRYLSYCCLRFLYNSLTQAHRCSSMSLSIILVFLSNSVFAQDTLDLKLSGLVDVDGHDELYGYVIDIQIVDSLVFGYSLMSGEHIPPTKSKITGTYSSLNELLTFKETELAKKEASESSDEFCFLHTSLAPTFRNNIKTFTGSFIGYLADGSECARGKVDLITEEEVNNAMKTISKSKKKTTKINLSDNEQFQITGANKNLIIELWDAGIYDGDIVSLFVNKIKVVDHLTLTKERKIIPVELLSGHNKIVLKAENKGRYNPNSSKIKISSIEGVYEITNTVKENNKTIITIICNDF